MPTLADLLTFAQQASRAAGQSVTGLVDLSTMALRPLGYNVPDERIPLSTAWAERKGLLAPPDQSAAGIAGQTLGGLLAPVTAAKAPQIAGGLLQAERNLAAPSAIGKAGQRGALDADAIGSVIGQHKQRLLDEANDWASRGYKRNDKVVRFRGDGPGPEAMRIGAINEGRRNANVESRMAQVRALNTLSDNIAANPARVEEIYNRAAANARNDLPRMGNMTYDQLLDAYIGQSLAGLKDWSHGPNSVGGALRRAIESGIKPASPPPMAAPAASSADDYLSQLFGN